jgi:hypothetical protein
VTMKEYLSDADVNGFVEMLFVLLFCITRDNRNAPPLFF